MSITRRNRGESLVPEDGVIAAQVLPLDVATSQRPYETATFGMG